MQSVLIGEDHRVELNATRELDLKLATIEKSFVCSSNGNGSASPNPYLQG